MSGSGLLTVDVPPSKVAGLRAQTRDQLAADARATLLARTLPGTFVYPLILALVAYSTDHFQTRPVLIASLIGGLGLVVVLRLVLFRLAKRDPAGWGWPAKTHLTLGVLSAAAFSSYAAFVFAEQRDAASSLAALMTTAGISSTVVNISSIHRPLALSWVFASLCPVVLFSLSIDGDLGFAVAGLFGVYLALMVPAVLNANGAYWTAQISAASLKEQSARMSALNRAAGMAEVSSNVLHDVGNTINGFRSSSASLRGLVGDVLADDVQRFVELLEEDRPALERFSAEHPIGEHLIPFVAGLRRDLGERESRAVGELDRIDALVAHIEAMLRRQREIAECEVSVAALPLAPLVSHAMLLADVPSAVAKIEVADDVQVFGDERRVLQILTNLLCNAKDALADHPRPRIDVGVVHQGEDVLISVLDNGVGTDEPVRRTRFQRGATSKPHGHGIGLHLAANLASVMGGQLSLASEGPGMGACATLKLRSGSSRPRPITLPPLAQPAQ
ncbi:MAG: ATP-binding protein [Nannocystaceae bacterium]|nr:ATP-binding protein [bacterium]